MGMPILKKSANDVKTAMENICQTAGVYPHMLQWDGDVEFARELSDWIKQHDIKSVKTLSYIPESNGLKENFNSLMRKMLRELMMGHANLIWYNYLDLCCNIKNKQKNSTTKKWATDKWNNTRYSKEKTGNIIQILHKIYVKRPVVMLQRIKHKS